MTTPDKFSPTTSDNWYPHPHPDPNMDLALKTAYDLIYSQRNSTPQLATSQLINFPGAVQAWGATIVTGSLKGVATGLSTVSNCLGVVDNGATASNLWLSVTPSAKTGAIDIFVWQPTSSSVTTPIAAKSAVVVRWMAMGTQQ